MIHPISCVSLKMCVTDDGSRSLSWKSSSSSSDPQYVSISHKHAHVAAPKNPRHHPSGLPSSHTTHRNLALRAHDRAVLAADGDGREPGRVDGLECILDLVQAAIRREDGQVPVIAAARHGSQCGARLLRMRWLLRCVAFRRGSSARDPSV